MHYTFKLRCHSAVIQKQIFHKGQDCNAESSTSAIHCNQSSPSFGSVSYNQFRSETCTKTEWNRRFLRRTYVSILHATTYFHLILNENNLSLNRIQQHNITYKNTVHDLFRATWFVIFRKYEQVNQYLRNTTHNVLLLSIGMS